MRVEQISIFESLIDMYERSEHYSKVPLEDFTTELLAGVLRSNQAWLDAFVSKVLTLEGGEWRVTTQKYYPLSNHFNCIVDMVFYNKDSIAFVENKVDSTLHTEQLERYETVLLQFLEDDVFQNVSLHYCTKRREEVTTPFEVKFNLFRWRDVYQFFLPFREDSLVDAFLLFLERKRLMKISELEGEDLQVLGKISSTMSKLEEIMELVQIEMGKRFGKPKVEQMIKELTVHDRYIAKISPAFADNYSDIAVGITFEDNAPALLVQVWCNRKNTKAEVFFRKLASQPQFFDQFYEKSSGWRARFLYPLKNIMGENDQWIFLEQWFQHHLNLMETFILETEELEWNIPIAREIIAHEGGDRFLLKLGSGRGQIMDLRNKVIHPAMNLDSLIKFGYWEENFEQHALPNINDVNLKQIKEYF
jgi:hypothetical protein